MSEIVFALEEASAKELLSRLVPRLLGGDTKVRFLVFEGKQDLQKQLPAKLRGYLNPSAKFLVLRDQDDHPDCKTLKGELKRLCRQAGRPSTTIRIACRELESFYLGDLAAVEKGLGLKGLSKQQLKQKFRNPDRLHSPSRELAQLTDGAYQKVSGSRAIAPHLSLEDSRSDSFLWLVAAIRAMR